LDLKYWLGNISEWLGVIAVVMVAGISPMAKQAKRIEFKYPRRESNYALTLFSIIYVFAFLYFSTEIFNFLKPFAAQFPGGEYADRTLIALVALIPLVVLLVARRQPIKSAGWIHENIRLGLIVGVMLALLTIFLRGKFLAILAGITKEQMGLLGILLILSIAEETIFRGYIQLRMDSRLGDKWGWLASAGFYFLWQIPGRYNVLTFAQLWPILLISLVQGLLCAFIMKKTNHVLAPALYRAVSVWMMLF
jgi:membrane protease YdiL (CAAX protease family)